MNAHFLDSVAMDIGQALDDSMAPRRPLLRAVDAQEPKTESAKNSDPILTRIAMHRKDISSHEKAISRMQRDQAVREAELQAELASLAQEIAERESALKREASEREASIMAAIEQNRSKWADEVRLRSKLAAMSHAAISEAEREFSPANERATIVHKRYPGMSDIAERVRAIIGHHLVASGDKVVDTATLKDLGADSLDDVELMCMCEEEFGIEINDNEFITQMLTVGDVVRFVERKFGQGDAP